MYSRERETKFCLTVVLVQFSNENLGFLFITIKKKIEFYILLKIIRNDQNFVRLTFLMASFFHIQYIYFGDRCKTK